MKLMAKNCAANVLTHTANGHSAHWGVVICLILACLLAGGCTKRAANSAEQQQRAIETLKGRPWFDSEKVAYLPPPVSIEFDDAMRTTGWEAAPDNPIKPTPPPAGRINWSGLGDGLGVMVWVILGIALIGLALLLATVSMKSWDRSKLAPKRFSQIEIDPTRVVDLPFEAAEEMRDPLERARQLANDGDYDAAVSYLYAYMLLALDRAGALVLHRGKTNRMYLMELGSQRRLRDLLAPVVLAFEDVYFGRHAIDRARFMSLWQSTDQFHQEVATIINAQIAVQADGQVSESTTPGTQEVSRL